MEVPDIEVYDLFVDCCSWEEELTFSLVPLFCELDEVVPDLLGAPALLPPAACD
jgi:hypothetical protein